MRADRTALALRRPVRVLAAAAVLVAAAGVLATGVRERLSAGGFLPPDASSVRAERLLAARFPGASPDLVLLAGTPAGVDAAPAAAAGRALTRRVAGEPRVAAVASYFSTGEPALRSRDRREALLLVDVGGGEQATRAAVSRLIERYSGRQGPLSVQAGGTVATDLALDRQTEQDLRRAELIAAPATLVILLLVFGSLVAAALPLLTGALAVVGAFAVLRLVAGLTDVSVFSLNIVTALGLGLAIDYSLFLVTRFREEAAAGADTEQAARVMLGTAGRTVAYSAVTVAGALSALLVFPQFYLRSFAYGGVAVVLLAAAVALTVVPALLRLLGPRIDALNLRRALRALPAAGRGARRRRPGAGWHALALAVMRRPFAVALAATALLVALGLPFLGVRFGLPDERALPPGTPVAQVGQALRRDFPTRPDQALSVVVPALPVGGTAALDGYARRLSALPGVVRVDGPGGSWRDGRRSAPAGPPSATMRAPGAAYLSVVPRREAGDALVAAVRAVPAPAPVLLGGAAASLADVKASIAGRLPAALAVVAAATVLLLFAFTGSVLLPVKALVLTLLSLTASFGAMVWVFQQGRLTWLVGDFTATGTVDATTAVLMFTAAYGLSMDYEIFLLSRIREQWLATGDNRGSVATGLERTGPLVSAAALLLATVLVSFATSGVSLLKLLGVGLALAVVLDATVVRGLLVPAFMRLAGRANWWAPAPLARLHRRVGLRGG